MFKHLDDAITGDALILHGKQLFIDDYVIAKLKGVKKVLNQPVKYSSNPLLRKHKREQALDADGKPIEGFTRADCAPINTDSVRHIVTWKGNPDCYLLQARPIKLRFYLKNAKLFSFEPTIRHNHYLQSYE